MRTARSAGVLCTLGATLTAVLSPQVVMSDVNTSNVAGINTGDVLGINTGDTLGINTGDVQGINTGDVLGINTGDTLGINTGDALGINTGDTLGINTGDVLGINTGDTLGINTGDVLGINTGDALGINTGDVLGINTGDTLGINTGDVLGINTGDALGINTGDTYGINTGDVLGINTGDSLVLTGPVDSIDSVNGVFTSMGQTVMASHRVLRDLAVGDLVSVRGSVVGAGWLYADGVDVSDDLYIPGSTPVLLAGLPTQFDRAVGTLRMGNLTIDYTPALAHGDVPTKGLHVFEGIQPVKDGVMISNAVIAAK